MVILFICILILAYLPQFWVRWVMRRHGRTIPDMPGNGAELARHLITRFDLEGYTVEETEPMQDHFAPADKAVRLSPDNYHGKSLTAIAVAAHEVGHALQHAREEAIFKLRSRYLPLASVLDQCGLWLLRLVPLVAIVVKAPPAVMAVVGLGLLLQLLGALAYLIVLPEEWDASFNKALPVLTQGNYVPDQHLPEIRRVLQAAALTYFAGALARLLNLGRLLFLFRR